MGRLIDPVFEPRAFVPFESTKKLQFILGITILMTSVILKMKKSVTSLKTFFWLFNVLPRSLQDSTLAISHTYRCCHACNTRHVYLGTELKTSKLVALHSNRIS